jgi:hypothetical protein
LKKGGSDKQKVKIIIKSNKKFHSKFTYKTYIHQCSPSSGILGELRTMRATLHDVELEHIELHKQLGMMQKRIEVLECEVAHKQEALITIETTEAKKNVSISWRH